MKNYWDIEMDNIKINDWVTFPVDSRYLLNLLNPNESIPYSRYMRVKQINESSVWLNDEGKDYYISKQDFYRVSNHRPNFKIER